MLRVELPYDAWCLRSARNESSKALAGLLRADVVEEVLLVITELVLLSSVHSRARSTLLLDRSGNDLVITVRSHDSGARAPHDLRTSGRIAISSPGRSAEYVESRGNGQRHLRATVSFASDEWA